MFLNFSNHPSDKWSDKQLDAARKYGEITDLPFPEVAPNYDSRQIDKLAKEYVNKITSLQPDAVMCQGEFTLTYAVVKKLKRKKIKVISACSERNTTEITDASGVARKIAVFEFIQFREYI